MTGYVAGLTDGGCLKENDQVQSTGIARDDTKAMMVMNSLNCFARQYEQEKTWKAIVIESASETSGLSAYPHGDGDDASATAKSAYPLR